MFIEVFYDASCPFCEWCAEQIRKRDKLNKILLTDMNKAFYMLELFGVSEDEAHEQIHIITKDGRIFNGEIAVRKILLALDYRKLVSFLSIPGVSWMFKKTINFVSKHRGVLSELIFG